MKTGCISGTRLYSIWWHMKARCTNPKHSRYPDYGGRGITICEAWEKNFKVFYDWAWDSGYTHDRTLDRIDPNQGYCPENCRWASEIEQRLNTREKAKVYTNVRLRADRMKVFLATIPDDAILTLVVNQKYFSRQVLAYIRTHQDSDYPIPENERKDTYLNRQFGLSRTAHLFGD